jgi:NADH-quinone oxidoreductase subunit G
VPSLTIDGREVSVPAGTTVIKAAEDLGIFIPRYCYHPGLSIAGNCRICLVEVEKFPKLQIACNTFVSEGMVVHTESDEAVQGRQSVLEFLLANHPLDCPVCDQSGECDLQNFYMDFGLYNPRFREQKVKKHKAVTLGPNVMLDQERCILCSRCVRFTDEITKTGEFGIFNRGDKAELGIYPGEELDNPYSANVVDICPVGALTERRFRFKARVWYLSSAATVCNGCSKGCNMDLHYVLDRPYLNDGKRMVRVKPRINPEVNEWWLCDEGRYGLGWIDEDRLLEVRGPSPEAGWDEALDALVAGLTRARVGVIASVQLTNEELFLLKKVLPEAQISAALPEQPGFSDDLLVQADKNPNSEGARLLGLAGPGVIQAEQILDAALAGELDTLWVFGHDLAQFFGEERVSGLGERVDLLVFSGTNPNPTADLAHWVLPTSAYVEKDGTFVNCDGRVQRIGRAFAPLGASREDWRLLLELARRLERPLEENLERQGPEGIFAQLAQEEAPFAGLTYAELGAGGSPVALSESTAGASAP